MTDLNRSILRLLALMGLIRLGVTFIILLCFRRVFGYFVSVFPELAFWRNPASSLAAPAPQPAVELTSIWQVNPLMAPRSRLVPVQVQKRRQISSRHQNRG